MSTWLPIVLDDLTLTQIHSLQQVIQRGVEIERLYYTASKDAETWQRIQEAELVVKMLQLRTLGLKCL